MIDTHAVPELEEAIHAFELKPAKVRGYIQGGLDVISAHGQHPEELPRRRSVHAFPALWHSATVCYILFGHPDATYRVILHLSLVRAVRGRVTYPATLKLQRPGLPAAAWNLAATRLEKGGW
jgi:hypothetical protein